MDIEPSIDLIHSKRDMKQLVIGIGHVAASGAHMHRSTQLPEFYLLIVYAQNFLSESSSNSKTS